MAPKNRRIRSVDDLIAPAVADTVRELHIAAEDAAAVRLAQRYAAAIDRAAEIAADLNALEYDENLARRVEALAAKVQAQTVLAELGPKLLAVLVELGATVKARAAVGKGGAPRGPSRLDVLRANRTG